jgi:hypothetical protein
LGGGLSCLSYVDIAKTGIFENIEIITFGAPRVGNRLWADWFDSITPSTRYFIKDDPIAILPRCLTFVCNYKQTGVPVMCEKSTEECRVMPISYEGPPSQYIDGISESLRKHMDEDEKVDGILDHIFGYKLIKDYTQID